MQFILLYQTSCNFKWTKSFKYMDIFDNRANCKSQNRCRWSRLWNSDELQNRRHTRRGMSRILRRSMISQELHPLRVAAPSGACFAFPSGARPLRVLPLPEILASPPMASATARFMTYATGSIVKTAVSIWKFKLKSDEADSISVSESSSAPAFPPRSQ